MKIMVAGGAGFIGSHLCDRLIADGHAVWCVDNLETGSEVNLAAAQASDRFRMILGDVRDGLPDVTVDRIYNLACPGAAPHYERDPVGTFRTNVLGTLNILDYCRRTGARMLQASSSEVYGDPEVHPQPESYAGSVSCTGPRACYDEGKRAAETACFDHHRQFGVEVRVARMFNTYGPRMSVNDGRVIPNFITKAILGDPLTIYGAGTHTRSFCYVDDMIDALIRLMEAPGALLGPINLGNPSEMAVRDLAERIIARTGASSATVHETLSTADARVRRPDISPAIAVLGWATSARHDGLDRTIGW